MGLADGLANEQTWSSMQQILQKFDDGKLALRGQKINALSDVHMPAV
jgi:hypothetical protein